MTVGRESEAATCLRTNKQGCNSVAVAVLGVLRLTAGVLISACIDGAAVPADPTVSNPTAPGVVCGSRHDQGDAGSDCRRTFDQCSDGLHYELVCALDVCACIADDVQQGEYRSSEASCDVDIGRMKVLCGWNLPDGRERVAAP